jgi:nitrogen fixation NifU-like protein
MADQYTDKVIEHFTNPRNVGVMENPDGLGKVGNPICGDIMELSIKVRDGIVQDAKFRTFGCAAAIATSSIVTEMVKGKTIDEALQISNRAVMEALDGLPARKRHCSVLAEEALQSAIADYYKRRGETIPETVQARLQHLAAQEAH